VISDETAFKITRSRERRKQILMARRCHTRAEGKTMHLQQKKMAAPAAFQPRPSWRTGHYSTDILPRMAQNRKLTEETQTDMPGAPGITHNKKN